MKGQTLRPYQVEAIERLRSSLGAGHRRVVLVLPTGCHAKGQLVLMYDGTLRAVEDVRVGDRLMGPDSLPRTVLQLCGGREQMHRIVPVKGEPFVVNEGHVLTLVRTGDKNRPGGEIVDVTVRDWLGWSAYAKHVHKLFRVGVEFDGDEVLPLDPYFVGVLLGDGVIVDGVGVSKPDPEIRAVVEEQAALHGAYVTTCGQGTSATMRISCGRRDYNANPHPVIAALRRLSLYRTKSGTKFIPQAYKVAPRAARLQLLAGLMDTDGSLSNGGYDFISKSRALADDVAFVARSLGFAAYVVPCEKRAQTGAGGTYYRMTISGDVDQIPCRIPRKKAAPRRQKKNVLRTGFSVEPAGEDDYYGFTLDGDGRYLLGDFTVTHNSGKTSVAAKIIESSVAKGNRVLFLAHQRELIQQCSDRLLGEGVEHGVIMAGHPRYMPWLPVQVASVQTVARRGELPDADLIIPDECHHVRSSTYEGLFTKYPRARVVGLTATPIRGDGKGLGSAFDDLVVGVTPRELIDQGYLVPYTGYAYDIPELREVKRTSSGDLDEEGLELVMGGTKIMGNVVEQYLLHARGRRAVLFAVSINHSKAQAERFRAAGVAAEHIDGTMPVSQRDAALERMRTGETQVICNCALLTEGVDIPALEVCIIVRPTLSLALHLQMIGRVLRPAPGKEIARIHDHAGNVMRHGPPDAERTWELHVDRKKAQKPPPIRVCEKCYAMFPPVASGACPSCGHVAEKNRPARELEEITGPEVRAIPIESLARRVQASVEERRAYYDRMVASARATGRQLGWAAHRYKAKFGEFPPWSWKPKDEEEAA